MCSTPPGSLPLSTRACRAGAGQRIVDRRPLSVRLSLHMSGWPSSGGLRAMGTGRFSGSLAGELSGSLGRAAGERLRGFREDGRLRKALGGSPQPCSPLRCAEGKPQRKDGQATRQNHSQAPRYPGLDPLTTHSFPRFANFEPAPRSCTRSLIRRVLNLYAASPRTLRDRTP